MNRGLENGSGWFDPVFKGFEDAGWYVSPRSQAVYIPLMSTPFFSEAAVSSCPPRIERRGLNKDVVVGGGRVEAGHASNLHEHKSSHEPLVSSHHFTRNSWCGCSQKTYLAVSGSSGMQVSRPTLSRLQNSGLQGRSLGF